MWKSLGCGIGWKPFCGFLVEDEGFNKWVWQCVWSQLAVELHPLPWYRRNAAALPMSFPDIDQICVLAIDRILSVSIRPWQQRWAHICWHGALRVSGVESLTCSGCSNWLYSIELLFIISHFMSICLGWAALVSRHVIRPKARHAALTGMCFLFRSTLLTGDSLVKFLLDHFFFGSCTLAREFLRLTGGFREKRIFGKKEMFRSQWKKGGFVQQSQFHTSPVFVAASTQEAMTTLIKPVCKS